MNRIFRLIIGSLAVLALPLAAQTDAKSTKVKFRVTRFDPEDKAPPPYEAGTDRIAFQVPLNYIDGPHTATLREGRFLDFFPGKAEKPEFSLTIAENERTDLLLYFIRNGDSYKVLKILTPPANLRGGDRYVLNGTDSRLGIKLDKQEPLFLDSGKSGIVRGPGGNEIVSLPVLISRFQNDEWKLASTENWYIDPRSRGYLFAYISPRTRQLTFHVITERL
jgi:hypothetical protein